MAQTLAVLLARRGRLTAGEVVTVGVPIAGELAGLHARGRVHGAVTASVICFDADGRPGLTDPRPSDREAGEDVRELAAVLRRTVGPGAPPELVSVIDDALDAEGSPDAGCFARELYAACPPEPLRLSKVAPTRAPRRHRLSIATPRRRRSLAPASGVVWARAGTAGHTTVAPTVLETPAVVQPSWVAVLSRLDATRDAGVREWRCRCLGRGLRAGLGAAPSRQAIAATVGTAHRVHARDLHMWVVSVRAISTSPERVTLHVVDRLSAYDVVDGRGHVVEQRSRTRPAGLVDRADQVTSGLANCARRSIGSVGPPSCERNSTGCQRQADQGDLFRMVSTHATTSCGIRTPVALS